MRKICTGILAAALALGLLAVEPAQAKVYKMTQEERAAALKEKKQKRAKAKKSGKAAPGQDQGGWVEVKPGEKPARKNKKASVDELAKAAEKKGEKGEKGKKGKKTEKAAPEKQEKAEKKSARQPADSIVVEKKGRKSKTGKAEKAEKIEKSEKIEKAEKPEKAEKVSRKSSRKAGTKGDRAVGSNYSGERKVSASSTEVRRTGDEMTGITVSRPAPTSSATSADKPVAAPEVRHEVQSGPMDASKPVGTEQKAGEGRF